MSNPLIPILKDCWVKIEKIYNDGKICSERHLQAEIFSILSHDDRFKNIFQVFVEPRIFSKDDKVINFGIIGIKPDMIITQKDRIVCVYELKYVPYFHHGHPEYQKDIINLSKFYELKGSNEVIFYLETNPKTGDWNYERRFTIDDGLLIAYSAIAKKDSDAFTLAEEIFEGKRTDSKPIENYIYLKGIINKDNYPNFDIDPKRDLHLMI